ncbi:transglycosylase SLT domain-containing protein [Xanthomonas sontii]|uniref:transglycosylase SLT domain-containing protein n=1 Tax=Xanthomonas sontii TaxID=2650745 RepID=UPI0011E49E64|nr:transglycosylase SLT domain-containing protein [Xanthomonas sontii]MDQ7761202.1 transglycosylase SLT domain-containing protein [Xanthomonas sontii]TYD37812.1 lytic murein transglycosylase [Xanthomonas sontii]UZK06052.1 transglycosylase SLT domain-containing protein [Xanthomonas sontii]
MILRTSLLLFAAALCGPVPALAQSLDAQRPAIRSAIDDAEQGRFDPVRAAAFKQHPLYGWLEYANLRRNIDKVSDAQAQDFLKRYAGQPVAESFRALWLPALARREDWPALLANWKPTENLGLRCAQLNARQATGRADAQWVDEAQALWRNAGKSLPDACDPVFAVLQARGGMTDALRWARVEAAADAQQPAVMRAAARGLPAADLALANDYAAFLDAVHTRALTWPKTERSRKVAVDGLAKLAKTDPDAAERQLPQFVQALQFSEAQRGAVLYQIALWTVASYGPESARRLNAVPESAYDERLHEWRAREAMARGDWPAALAAIRKMPPAQRNDSRWQYFEARLAEKTGNASEAQRLYRAAASSATFHGFLAADRLKQPYALCPWEPNDSAQAQAAVARDPSLVRALELFKIDRAGWAVAEWNDALSRFDDTQRRMAVEVASANGWFDRAVFGLGKRPEEQRLYTLRFPLHHADTIRREAGKNAIDPAWVAAEIRAESVFNPNARSPANAMGLMQVVPATGASVARNLGLAGYGGAASLYDPDTNIAIGTAYLRQLLNTYGLPYLTIAAYNAGPGPAARWQSQRPGHDADFWIETVSYKETREYVARILAFSVIYDWRLNGDALPVTERMLGKLDAPRKKFVCTAADAAAGNRE